MRAMYRKTFYCKPMVSMEVVHFKTNIFKIGVDGVNPDSGFQ